ncbi:Plasmodium vivax Vir protein, putative [Plasmodium vivax]|uniref:Vir protein, putative n=1 Tax=Plasmodium vivax TaxID=5855 RepID=A0A1G4E247_PLAVI|nr:Plasmodium vivax Vir protein, putative [Plasmodium vivax]
MTKCTSISKDYIDYKCYQCLKDKFDYCTFTDSGRTDLNSVLDSMHEKFAYFTPNNEILEGIVKHLKCNSVIMETDTDVACKYINFWLYEKVKVKYFYNYDSIFKNFEEFVKKFYKVVTSYRNYESCTKSIKIPDNVEYNKMKTLYTLYKKYDNMKFMHTFTDEWMKTCKNIHYITTQANLAARSYYDDEEFIKVLRHLRDVIKNGEGIYKSLCDRDLLELKTMVTESAFPPRNTEPPPPKERLQSPDSLEQHTHQTLAQHVSGNGIPKKPEPNVDLQASSRTVQLSSGEHLTHVPHERSPPEAQRPMESSLGVSHHAGEFREDVFESPSFSREQYEPSRDEHSRSVHTRYKPVEEGYTTEAGITPTDGTQSYLEGFKGTITGVLGSVDPGPVLVVSGGMGALFLLFKLDLSLEEEEDDSVKFLELLEDLHQEISQIFMNMKVGILDMVQ